MSVFRTRRIKTKYAKLRKKNLQILQSKNEALKKKNWSVVTESSDIEILTNSIRYSSFFKNIVTRKMQSLQLYNTQLYYDYLIKTVNALSEKSFSDIIYDVHNLHEKRYNVNIFSPQQIVGGLSPLCFVFYSVSICVLHSLVRPFFVSFFDSFSCKFIIISRRFFGFTSQFLPQDGFFLLVIPSNFIGNISSSNLISLCFDSLGKSNVFNLDVFSKVSFIGVCFNGVFIPFVQFLNKLSFVYYFLFYASCSIFDTGLCWKEDEQAKHPSVLLENIKENATKRDDTLFVEARSQHTALLVQEVERSAFLNSPHYNLLTNIKMSVIPETVGAVSIKKSTVFSSDIPSVLFDTTTVRELFYFQSLFFKCFLQVYTFCHKKYTLKHKTHI